nr:phenylacetate-coenzyme A ligase [uncultured bacterium]
MREALYAHLPISLQNLACSWYGRKEAKIRLGSEFESHLSRLLESERWSRTEIQAYQDEKVRNLVRYAYEYVPFYHDRMQERRLKPDDFQSVSDLPKLPILTKEEVRSNRDRLLSSAPPSSPLQLRYTSGTTGKSLELHVSRSAIAMQWAMWWRHRMRFGIRPGTWHVNFTGKPVVPMTQKEPPFWRWNRPARQALVNMQQLTPEKIAPIVDFLSNQGFELYTGYPSIVHALAMAANEAGMRLHNPPKLIATGAENVLPNQRADIVAFTGSVLTDQWGMTEACANASQCPSLVYHEDFEFGVIERIEEWHRDGMAEGKLLCTGFLTPEFPLIRYDVGDVGMWTAEKACSCGLQSPVLAGIVGRTDDYVLTPEGTRIMRFDYIFKHAPTVSECQVVQHCEGAIQLRIVRRSDYSYADEQLLREEIRRWISPTLRVEFVYVREIEREANGKFRAVKSLLRA